MKSLSWCVHMSGTVPFQLTADQLKDYERDGYLVVEGVLGDDEVDAFLTHQETLTKPQEGLHIHLADPQWRRLATHPNVAGVAAQLLDGTPGIVQTMYLPKKAGDDAVGFALHQDAHYLPAEPNTLMACWIALSDTGSDNGGLCVVPGSHHQGLRTTHKSSGNEHGNWQADYLMRDREGKEWTQTFYSFEIDDLDPDSVRKLQVPKGGGVFFTSLTIHGSFANRSATEDRLAWAVHYVRDGTWLTRMDVQETVAVPVRPRGRGRFGREG